ncbi:sensor histidine kinase [Nocardiopsis sediminis]|uniref:histidine kinase n=1 Tax=Nocardiopsis sediminis TaxID=1778267 RepID=A0ABV8FIS7_9ACTN
MAAPSTPDPIPEPSARSAPDPVPEATTARPVWGRVTVRAKLTLIYTAAFLVGGALLVALNYSIVSESLASRSVMLSDAEAEPRQPNALPEVGPSGGPASTEPVSPTDDGESDGWAPSSGDAASSSGDAAPSSGTPISLQVLDAYQEGVLSDLLLRSAAALAGITVLAAAAGWLIVGRPLRRLHRVTETARRLSERDLDSRLALTGPADEFRELGDTFDGMLERLQAAFDSQRRFVANASHELRTPLAVQRAAVEVPLEQGRVPDDLKPAVNRVLDSVERSERLIAGLLLLARSDRGIDATEPVELADAVDGVVRLLAADASAAGVTLRPETVPAEVPGDPVLLEHLVRNLVENAIRYNRADGEVTIGVERSDGGAVLRVANTGPEIADADVLFEPFHRGGHVRTHRAGGGSGLGLSIVRSVVTAHGGEVTAAPREGGGLEVTVRLPASGPARERAAAAAGADRRDGPPLTHG